MSWIAVAVVGTAAVSGAYNQYTSNKAAGRARDATQAGIGAALDASGAATQQAQDTLQPIVTNGFGPQGIGTTKMGIDYQTGMAGYGRGTAYDIRGGIDAQNAVQTDRYYGQAAQTQNATNNALLARQYGNVAQDQYFGKDAQAQVAGDQRFGNQTESYVGGNQRDMYNIAGGAAYQGINRGNDTYSAISAGNQLLNSTGSSTLAGLGAASSNWQGANRGVAQQQALLGAGAQTLAGQTGDLNVAKYLDPSMDFALKTGSQAIQGSAASRGLLNSGATLKDLTQFGTGLASQNYQQAVQNASADRAQQIGIGNTLLNTGNQGVTTGANLAQGGTSLGANLFTQGVANNTGLYNNSQAAANSLYSQGAGINANLYGQQAGINANLYGQQADRTQQLYLTGVNNTAQQAGQQSSLDASLAQSQAGINSQQFGAGVGNAMNLYGTGASALTNQSNIQNQAGSDAASLLMASGNANAQYQIGARSPLSAGITSGLNAFGGYMTYGSDPALKEEIEKVSDKDIDEFLAHADASTFNYTERAMAKGNPRGKQLGIMAPDLQKSKIGKRMVSIDKDGDKQVSGEQTIGALLAVASHLNKRVKKLEGKK